MDKEQEYLQTPGSISVKEAAAKLDLSEKRILQYIYKDRLPARKVRGKYMIRREDFDEFRSKPHGRIRTNPTQWRPYRAGAKVRELHIEVQANPDTREILLTRLKVAIKEQAYLFPGTMQRYVLADVNNPNTIFIQLIWKTTELTNEANLQHNLEAFQAKFADLLDWQTARYVTVQAIMHT
jgi:excisionase family DNA binding protein